METRTLLKHSKLTSAQRLEEDEMSRRSLFVLLIGIVSVVSGVQGSPATGDAAVASAGQWSSIRLGREEMGVAVVGTQVLIAGGRPHEGSGADPATVNIYDGVTGQWSTARLSESRVAPTSATVGSRVFFAGGRESDAVDIYDSATGQWSTAQLSQARVGEIVATVGSRVLFAGGPGSDAVHVYDSGTGQWATAQLSQARTGPTVVTVGTQVLFIGGSVGRTADPDASVDIYDSAIGQWSAARLSQPRRSFAIATVGTRVIVAGGDLSETAITDAVDIYDSATGQWSTARLAVPRGGRAKVVQVGDQVMFVDFVQPIRFSGQAYDENVGVVDIYNNATGQWSSARLSPPRGGVAVVAIGDRVLFAGGQGVVADTRTDPTLDTVNVYEVSTGQWSSARLSQPGSGRQVTTIEERALFVGSSGVVDIYDNTTGQWSAARLSQPRSRWAIATVGSRVLFAGGTTGSPGMRALDNVSDVVDIYDAATGTWSTAALSVPREAPKVARAGGRVLFIGGVRQCSACPPRYYDTVDIYDSTADP
jgi:hypothetical protein